MKLNFDIKIGFILGLIIILMSLLSFFWTPYEINETNPFQLSSAQKKHLFGTDHLGRDNLSRIMAGGRNSLLIAVCTVTAAALTGCLLGFAAGFLRGIAETIIMRIIDALNSFPGILLALLFAALFENRQLSLFFALYLIFIPSFTRITRSGALQTRNSPYIEAEIILGAGFTRITFIHILPNIFPSLLSASVLGLSNAILAESAMSYLGLGIQPPNPSWGRMLYESQSYFTSAPWNSLIPGLFIMITVIAFHFLGEGLRQNFSAKDKGITGGSYKQKAGNFSCYTENLINEKQKEPLLKVCDLSIGIKKNDALFKPVNGINFHINQGEILGLAGVSGCGKTLTALSIANLLPDAAHITNGKILYKEQNSKSISMIFQETKQSLNPLMKAGKQITETLELAGIKDKKQNKEKAINMLISLGFNEPEKIFNSYPHELSGGMCQRVMAAIAAIKEPALLIADEPSSALDEESQKCILSLLAKMNREKKMSILLISHDLSIIKDFCTRYLVIHEGKIIEEGLPDSFPLSRFNRKQAVAEKEIQPLLSVMNVSNKYILKNINLELKKGEIFGLAGKSGCGKTTLARAILGLIDYEGSIHLFNQKPRRGQLQMVFQEPGTSLNPRKKIGWLLEEPLVIHKTGTPEERKRKVNKMLLRVGLDPSYKNRRVHELSGGQKQRVCIARALILEPSLLVADEATSALDVRAQAQILKLFKKLNNAMGLTILFISHNREAVEYLCDRVAIMENGRIEWNSFN